MKYDNLLKIAEKIAEIPSFIEKDVGDGRWTYYVKKCALEVGADNGYRVCTSGFSEFADEEWLYDLVWFNNTDDPFLKEVGLVMESEWSSCLEDIRYDFEKLHLANAPLKVLICQTCGKAFESMREHFSRSIKAYDRIQKDSLYLISILINSEFRFEHCILDSAGEVVATSRA